MVYFTAQADRDFFLLGITELQVTTTNNNTTDEDDENNNNNNIQTVRIYCQDIGMEFGIEKCIVQIMRSGK